MEIEIELSKIISAYNILESGIDTMKKFKGKTALKISLLKIKLKDFYTTSEEIRQSLIKDKYGEIDGDGSYLVSNENLQLFINEYNDVLNTKHTIIFTPLTWDDLDNMDISLETSDTLVHFFED